jgi:hypothetical protein
MVPVIVNGYGTCVDLVIHDLENLEKGFSVTKTESIQPTRISPLHRELPKREVKKDVELSSSLLTLWL